MHLLAKIVLWLSVCYVSSSGVLCLPYALYWSRTSNGRECKWVMLMRAGVVCRTWGQRGVFHLSVIIRWWLCYVFAKVKRRSFLVSPIVDFCWLGVVRAWWRSWVRNRVGCGVSGMHMPTGVYWSWCTWYVLYIFVLDVDRFDLYTRGDKFGSVICRHHCACTYWCYLFEFWVYHGLYYLCRMWFGY